MERHTRQRQAIYEAIATSSRPLLPQEILDAAITAVPRMSIATVYRTIKALLDERRICSVFLPAQNPRYELAKPGHHHHFQCRHCDRVFDIEGCPGNLLALAPRGFVLEDHELILYGCCSDCALRQTTVSSRARLRRSAPKVG
ncbi:MAG: transcriptional repressor [Burkholderiaceae bacterium]|nr:transcriptional repressor [Burkholderiaceae bacterium]